MRIVQGVRGAAARNHMLNCVKYCMGIVVVVMHERMEGERSAGGGGGGGAWLVLACLSIVYAFWWV